MQSTLTNSKKRIDSIDLLRGIIMVIMALDHSRDFFHQAAFSDDPLNLATTTPFLYFTRWIKNFCISCWCICMAAKPAENKSCP
jgi:uncharacterized membrane protein